MPHDDSVSRWLDGLRKGDAADVQRLWDRYFQSLVRVAGSRLRGHSRRDYDEEDVALSAFHSLCDRVGRGQFPLLTDRDDLWRLLVTITSRKVVSALRHQGRQKRGSGRVVGESGVMGVGGFDEGMAQFLGREPTPEDAAQFTEEYERLLSRLNDETLRFIALKKLDGHNSESIAAELGTSARTVDRKLNLIRKIWEEEEPA